MGKDLLKNPYGRFYHLAYHLANLGHNVELILISYKKEEDDVIEFSNIYIRSYSLFPNPVSTIMKIYKLIKSSGSDWIFGFSDIYYGVLAQTFARKLDQKCLIDAYDNYEAYMPWLKPLHWLWRFSVKRATVVTCAGQSLNDLFRNYRRTKPIHILPMTVDGNLFFEQSREECRQKLDLPLNVKLIGYHGSISDSRDIRTLFSAAKKIINSGEKIKFVVSGRKDKNIKIPAEFIYKGYLPDSDVPLLLNSLDVLVVTNKDSIFGNYSYPVKLYEAMACHIPVVVSKTESTKWILRKYPQYLVEPEDNNALIEKINEVIKLGRVSYERLPTWEEITDDLSQLIIKN
jgi:glycosyltransferase involved in cell wall biosynthesis